MVQFAFAPSMRVTCARDVPVRRKAAYVLYWMTSARRTSANFALDHALAHCQALGVPLLIFEALRVAYPWASDRLHHFVIDGMADNAKACAASGITYFPYLEPSAGAGAGLFAALAAHAAVVVTDEFPCFFLPQMLRAAARQADTRIEVVDGNGLLPMRAADAAFPTALAFRRHLQRNLATHLQAMPHPTPLPHAGFAAHAQIPNQITARWTCTHADALSAPREVLARLPIDHGVGPVERGGARAAQRRLQSFLDERFARYVTDRGQPEPDVASGLSGHLHFGHIGVHEIARAVWHVEDWQPTRIENARANGKREGFWGMAPHAEGFMDELVTWRELGYGFCHHRSDYARYESLPPWAQATLNEHASDKRSYLYTAAEFETGATHDALWNAAQHQLVREGRIQNYLRMLWGKKILEWSPSPQAALATMIHLNNKYAIDGRNPNSYSGIFWTLGRFDRPWAPKRPIFGCIRYMSSDNTARKFNVKPYLAKFGAATRQTNLFQR